MVMSVNTSAVPPAPGLPLLGSTVQAVQDTRRERRERERWRDGLNVEDVRIGLDWGWVGGKEECVGETRKAEKKKEKTVHL